jgi:hypothetical protein
MDMMQSASKLMSMGLADNAEELGRTSEMAVVLGQAFGRDAATAIEEWSLMMANMSIPRLDTFGISSGKVRDRINELMDSVKGMTRDQAFMIATMEQGAIAMDRLGGSATDTKLRFEQLQARIKDLKVEVGTAFAEVVSDAWDTAELLINWNKRIEEAQKAHRDELFKTAETYEQYADEVLRLAGYKQQDLVYMEEAGHDMARFRSEIQLATREQFIHARAIEDDRRVTYDWTQAVLNATRAQADWAEITKDDRRVVYDFSGTMQLLAGNFDDALKSADSLEDMLYQQAVAAGVSQTALATLAYATGDYTQEQLLAALTAAAFTEKAKLLAEDLAAGKITVFEAAEELRRFREELENLPAEKRITLRLDIIGQVPTEFAEQQRREGRGSGVPEYQTGAWNIPAKQYAVLHAGEMVLPPGPAERLRQQIVNNNQQYNVTVGSYLNSQQRGALFDQVGLLGRV